MAPARKEERKKSAFDKTLMFMVLFVNVTSFVLISFFPAATRAATKPFDTFEEFYPFYISQHADQTCRRLHVIGTAIILLLSFFEHHIISSMIMAAIMGYGVFVATKEFDHGIIEMVAMLSTFLIFMRKLSGSWLKAFAVPIIAYGFAWAGHFMFEHNKPATFIYPIFSLAGDFRLFGEVISRQRDF
jgi:hypothetical protein